MQINEINVRKAMELFDQVEIHGVQNMLKYAAAVQLILDGMEDKEGKITSGEEK